MPADHQTAGEPSPLELAIEEALDLHGIPPRQIQEVVLEYLRLAREKHYRRVRLIHGKGIGRIRETVHAALRGHPEVISFSLAPAGLGSWGATLVWLRASEADGPPTN